MTRTRVSDGLYRSKDGAFWIRPTLAGGRTWRRLASLTVADAKAEAAVLMADHHRSGLGLCRDPFAGPVPTVAEAAAKAGRILPKSVLQGFGSMPVTAVTLASAMEHGARRPTRAADLDIAQLSAVLTWCHRHGLIQANPLLGRPRFHRQDTVRHCREVMPADGDELHRLARALLSDRRSQGIGWQLLFAALTGCRTQELLALRMDAAGRNDPGWIEGRFLYLRRSKGGRFPYVELTPELRECIAAHRAWHDGTSPWWFPGADLFRPLDRTALTHALTRITRQLGLPHRTAHGLRAYFVTVHRSRGASNEQVAALIGDRTSGLIESVYGGLPEVWAGGEPLSFLPAQGEPAWRPWIQSAPANVVAL